MKLFLSAVAIFALFNGISGLAGKAPTKVLNDGNKIPTLALGTFGFEDIPKMRSAVNYAIEAGYRHIDTAALYDNEQEIGKGISDVLKKGLVKREELFVTTKLWNDKHARDQVVPALRESLAKLGLDYVDLYLIHSPEAMNEDGSPANIDYLDTWKGMEEAKQLGLTKSIGVSNFNTEQIDRIKANSKTVPAVNQIEIHPSNTQEKLVADCFARNIAVMAYSPFGFFVKRGEGNKPGNDDPRMVSIAKKYNKSVTQIVLRYLLDRDLIPIPKSTNQARIQQNIDVFDFHLTPQEIATISSFNKNTSIFS
uniref:Aldehyde reductase 1 n=1 Tax=Helicoverpa armigera TaxID=29058 RepID=A0A291P0U1_HELAM|nr:aldehyde reductase 1 [Helicoverpa armigera]